EPHAPSTIVSLREYYEGVPRQCYSGADLQCGVSEEPRPILTRTVFPAEARNQRPPAALRIPASAKKTLNQATYL
ncbi:MAG: hypothetical protein Q8R28_13885, partial [Dehalococcoidia bacterium]|nr:hypothetical protein [Dehalococcoidia bacterium]